MRLVPVLHAGHAAMDRRFSVPMLPWVVAEIRKRDAREKLSLGIEDGELKAYDSDFEVCFSHALSRMTRFSQADSDPCTFLYLLRDEDHELLYCYLFQAEKTSDVLDLFQQMKLSSNTEPSSRSSTRRSSATSTNLNAACAEISPSSSNFFEVLYVGKIKVWNRKVPETFIDDALDKFKTHEFEKSKKTTRRGSIDLEKRNPKPHLTRSQSVISGITIKNPDVVHDDDHNRTMVLQIDRNDLRLISPDRKLVLLKRHRKDVTTCVRGIENPEHFGFISRELTSIETFIGYVFKCESSSVAIETVNAITQSFGDKLMRGGSVKSCEKCPMVWFHRLCCDLENLSDKRIQTAIFRRLDQLDEEEKTTITTKLNGIETDSIKEKNELLMMLLRAHCEMNQSKHSHEVSENRELLNYYLGNGNAIIMKAKKSISSSFEGFLRRRASRDDFNLKEESADKGDREFCEAKGGGDVEEGAKGVNSAMIETFTKIDSPNSEAKSPESLDRKAIYKKVAPVLNRHRKLDQHDIRLLWKTAIRQAILLVRMEKENAKLKARQEESESKKLKLDYDDSSSSSSASFPSDDVDDADRLRELARRVGVPKWRRGEVWARLSEATTSSEGGPPDELPSYEGLLKRLTSHQHAILIDLGRTYPAHPYYRAPLGEGQLALFNLLKAYSLLDPEVGYCQGLSFVAGILLLHMEEPQAFRLLRHLMLERDLRDQYLPDMTGLRSRLYAFSRLLRDRLPDLYAHFDQYEVSPTLYAAPWILTLFASQFPIGFAARVFDTVFSDGPDIAFSIGIAILKRNREELLRKESFEEITSFLKTELPRISSEKIEEVIEDVYKVDYRKKLEEYKVEFKVLREELESVEPYLEKIKTLEKTIEDLKTERDKIPQLESEIKSLTQTNDNLTYSLTALTSFINDLSDLQNLPGSVRKVLKNYDKVVAVTSPTGSVDSGVDSPKSEESSQSHPLDDGSANVEVTYTGRRELKKLGSSRNLRNC